MNKLLAVIIFFTSPMLLAEENVQYFLENISCESTGEINREEIEESVYWSELAIGSDQSDLVVLSDTEEHFTLRSMGKKTFLAVPSILTGMMRNFFVSFDDNNENVQILKTDPMAKICGGGLVIYSYTISI